MHICTHNCIQRVYISSYVYMSSYLCIRYIYMHAYTYTNAYTYTQIGSKQMAQNLFLAHSAWIKSIVIMLIVCPGGEA